MKANMETGIQLGEISLRFPILNHWPCEMTSENKTVCTKHADFILYKKGKYKSFYHLKQTSDLEGPPSKWKDTMLKWHSYYGRPN